jgi:hypothetical protein
MTIIGYSSTLDYRRNPWSRLGVDDYSDEDLRCICRYGISRLYSDPDNYIALEFNVFNAHEAQVVAAFMCANAPQVEYYITRVA